MKSIPGYFEVCVTNESSSSALAASAASASAYPTNCKVLDPSLEPVVGTPKTTEVCKCKRSLTSLLIVFLYLLAPCCTLVQLSRNNILILSLSYIHSLNFFNQNTYLAREVQTFPLKPDLVPYSSYVNNLYIYPELVWMNVAGQERGRESIGWCDGVSQFYAAQSDEVFKDTM